MVFGTFTGHFGLFLVGNGERAGFRVFSSHVCPNAGPASRQAPIATPAAPYLSSPHTAPSPHLPCLSCPRAALWNEVTAVEPPSVIRCQRFPVFRIHCRSSD